MSQHKNNPMAKLAAQASIGGPQDIRALASAVEIAGYGYGFQVAVEPNPTKKAEIQAFLDAELLAGKKPGDINVQFELKPEDQDVVVYHEIQQARHLRVIDKTMVVKIRGAEHYRMPLAEVLNRAQQAVEGGPPDAQA